MPRWELDREPPSFSSSPINCAWISVVKLALSSATLHPRKITAISTFSDDLRRHSTPAAEARIGFRRGVSNSDTDFVVTAGGDLTIDGDAIGGLSQAANITTAAGTIYNSAAASFPEFDVWTPVLTFATPGDLAVTYAVQGRPLHPQGPRDDGPLHDRNQRVHMDNRGEHSADIRAACGASSCNPVRFSMGGRCKPQRSDKGRVHSFRDGGVVGRLLHIDPGLWFRCCCAFSRGG
jgi:hypothetical protein